VVDGLNVGVRVHPVIHSMYAVDVSQMVAAVGELVGVHVLVSRRGGGGGAAHISSGTSQVFVVLKKTATSVSCDPVIHQFANSPPRWAGRHQPVGRRWPISPLGSSITVLGQLQFSTILLME
jgi:hypothetical protein